MTQRWRNRLTEIAMLLVLTLAAALALPGVSHAGMIATDGAQTPAQSERERVKTLLARPEVTKEMQKMGVSAAEAAARVDAMSDGEVAQLAGKLDALPAGGALSNQELLLIILLVIVVALLI